jgi:hypothetical protein
MPSFTDFAFLAPIVFLFGRMDGVKTLLSDGDTGWHIRTGEWITAHHGVPRQDIFSFSKPGAPWYAWEWLSDVFFAWMNAHGGLRTVVMFGIVTLALTFALLFRLSARKANPVFAISLTVLAIAASSVHWLARPHLFTLLFAVLFYSGLERTREGRSKVMGVPYLALFPLATVLWTNLHGGFFVGVLMIGIYGAGEALEAVFSADAGGRPGRLRRARSYFLSAGACLAASLINPYGYRLHAHVIEYLRDPWNSQHIGEFLSPTFHHPAALYFEILLALALAAVWLDVQHGKFTQPLLILLWAHGALLASRNIPIFALVATPPAAAALERGLGCLQRRKVVAGWLRHLAEEFKLLSADVQETEKAPRWHLASACGVLLAALVIWAPHPPRKFRAEFDPKRYPSGALAVLSLDPGSRIFTNDEWGDYLIWRLYPSHRVFVDGRSDFYGDAFEEKYLGALTAKYDWEKTLTRFGVNTVLLPPDAPLTGVLKESVKWRVVYDDGIALVFRPAADLPRNQVSFARSGGETGRDREVTKTPFRDRGITEIKSTI